MGFTLNRSLKRQDISKTTIQLGIFERRMQKNKYKPVWSEKHEPIKMRTATLMKVTCMPAEIYLL